MTIDKAKQLYCSAMGLEKFGDHREGNECIANILRVAELTEKAGGELRSRQIVAMVILFTGKQFHD